MPNKSPVFSVIIRKFREEEMDAVNSALNHFEEALEAWPGFLGISHNQSSQENYGTLATVISFETLDDLIAWEQSNTRATIVEELSHYIEGAVVKNRLGDLETLLGNTPPPKKWKAVLVLTFWVFVVGAILGSIADLISPDYPTGFARYAVLLTINIILNSYIFLPKSMVLLHQLEKKYFSDAKKKSI